MKFQIAMMKQQESLQFEHYERQREKYGRTIKDLLDVSKQIRSIEELYRAGVTDKALEYTKQIGSILKPLVPEEYSDNPMLNILLGSVIIFSITFPTRFPGVRGGRPLC